MTQTTPAIDDAAPAAPARSDAGRRAWLLLVDPLLNRIFFYLNAYKHSFSIPINSKYDIVLLGGALGSLFSLLQAFASPIIGRASDRYGRRTALL